MRTTIKPLELNSNHPINKKALLNHLQAKTGFKQLELFRIGEDFDFLAYVKAGNTFDLLEENLYDLIVEVLLTTELDNKSYPIKLYFHELEPNALQFSGMEYSAKSKKIEQNIREALSQAVYDLFAPHLFEANPTPDPTIVEILTTHTPIGQDEKCSVGGKSVVYQVQQADLELLFVGQQDDSSIREYYLFKDAVYRKREGILPSPHRTHLLDENGHYYVYSDSLDEVKLDILQLFTVNNQPLTTRYFEVGTPNEVGYRRVKIYSDRALITTPVTTFEIGSLVQITRGYKKGTVGKVIGVSSPGNYQVLPEQYSVNMPEAEQYALANPICVTCLEPLEWIATGEAIGKYLFIPDTPGGFIAQIEAEHPNVYFIKSVDGRQLDEWSSSIQKSPQQQLFDTQAEAEKGLKDFLDAGKKQLQALLHAGGTAIHKAIETLITEMPDVASQDLLTRRALTKLTSDNSQQSAIETLGTLLRAISLKELVA